MTSEAFLIRHEADRDVAAIRALTQTAFADAPHSDGTEAEIIDRLRAAGALSLSLVAEDRMGRLIGHLAFSPVVVDGRDEGWTGLGPVSVAPAHQRRGIGSTLIAEGLEQIERQGARGCVLLGDPAYYGRFGFVADPNLHLADVPPEYFLALPFGLEVPRGAVSYHPGFKVAS